MKEYIIQTDTGGIEFGVMADNEAEARELGEDILNQTNVTTVTPL